MNLVNSGYYKGLGWYSKRKKMKSGELGCEDESRIWEFEGEVREIGRVGGRVVLLYWSERRGRGGVRKILLLA